MTGYYTCWEPLLANGRSPQIFRSKGESVGEKGGEQGKVWWCEAISSHIAFIRISVRCAEIGGIETTRRSWTIEMLTFSNDRRLLPLSVPFYSHATEDPIKVVAESWEFPPRGNCEANKLLINDWMGQHCIDLRHLLHSIAIIDYLASLFQWDALLFLLGYHRCSLLYQFWLRHY